MHNSEKISFEEILNANSKGAASKGDVLVREDGEDESLAVANAMKMKVDDCCGRQRVKSCLKKGSKKRVQRRQCQQAERSNTTQYNALSEPSYSILQVMKSPSA